MRLSVASVAFISRIVSGSDLMCEPLLVRGAMVLCF